MRPWTTVFGGVRTRRDGDYGRDAAEIAWTLSAHTESGSGGSLSCSRAVVPPTEDLTLAVKWTSQAIFNTTSGNVTLQAATLGLAPLEAWRTSYFSPSELANPNISGDTAGPDGDGIPNLLEYALNGRPKVANGSIRPRHEGGEGGANFFTMYY
jgi:hypothetical protein